MSPNSVRAGWNKGIKGSTGNHQGANNSIHIWAKNDPEGFRREQSRKCTISNLKHPRGGWIGGYTGLTGKDKEWVQFNGAEVTKEFYDFLNKE